MALIDDVGAVTNVEGVAHVVIRDDDADPTPGRVLKIATALLRIRAMSPEERARALERRKTAAPARVS